jgi:hypothetical protein
MILLYWKEEGEKKEAIVFVQESRVVSVCVSFILLFVSACRHAVYCHDSTFHPTTITTMTCSH